MNYICIYNYLYVYIYIHIHIHMYNIPSLFAHDGHNGHINMMIWLMIWYIDFVESMESMAWKCRNGGDSLTYMDNIWIIHGLYME